MHIARTGLAVAAAAALLILSGCASAEDLASPHGDPPSTADSPDDPSEEPTDEPDEPEPSMAVPEVGDCRRLSGSVVDSGFTDGADKPAACGKAHNAQTAYVTRAKGATKKALKRGDSNRVYDSMLTECRSRIASWTGGGVGRLSRTAFTVLVGVPPTDDVKLGADWVRCDVTLSGVGTKPSLLPKQTKGALGKENSDYDLCVRGDFARRGTTIVDCSGKHDYRAVGAISLGDPSGAYPGEGSVRKVLKRRCTKVAADYLGSNARYGYTYPTKEQWTTSTGFGTCYARTKK